MVIGIDPGLNGAVAILNPRGEIVHAYRMPKKKNKLDPKMYWDMVKGIANAYSPTMWVIEKVHSMPGQGVKSTFSFGFNFGVQCGFVQAIAPDASVTLVSPRQWTRGFFEGLDKDLGKNRSQGVFVRLWPDCEKWKIRTGKIHEGIADAALIARWWIDNGQG